MACAGMAIAGGGSGEDGRRSVGEQDDGDPDCLRGACRRVVRRVHCAAEYRIERHQPDGGRMSPTVIITTIVLGAVALVVAAITMYVQNKTQEKIARVSQ